MNKILNFIKERKKPLIVIGIVFFLIFIVYLPRLLDLLIFENSVPSALENGEWAGFLGSYLGGVLGGLCTLVTVVVTVRINQKQLLKAEQEKVEEERKKRGEEILSHALSFISDVEKWVDRRVSDELRLNAVQLRKDNYVLYNTQDMRKDEREAKELEREMVEECGKVTSSLHYLYLEITCQGSCTKLWTALRDLRKLVSDNRIDALDNWKIKTEQDQSELKKSVEEAIDNVKDALRESLTAEHPRDASKSQ